MHFSSVLASALLLSLSSFGLVAAQAFERPHGIDSGNTACTGACVADPKLLNCPRTQYRPQYGCFMCCISDDDMDRLDEGFASLDDNEAGHGDDDDY
ncbi:hypothetical protein BJX64DRAFT_248643 [Aspergillus heterothallicus]